MTHIIVPPIAKRFPLFRAGVRDPQSGRVNCWWLGVERLENNWLPIHET